MPPLQIPVLLLKTRSLPQDAYKVHFSKRKTHCSQDAEGPGWSYEPIFVPVLEHQPSHENLQQIGTMLRNGTLPDEYGGMIFTSQRAVEGFAGVVNGIGQANKGRTTGSGDGGRDEADLKPHPVAPVRYPIFPIYTVGPATARSLTALLVAPDTSKSTLPTVFSSRSFDPQVLGSHTGNGATLAQYILRHYNLLHADHMFTHYEAPRLPFIPLLGPGALQYVPPGRRRLEKDDPRLRKKPLLFLVGEQRRDIIPVSLARGWVNHVASQNDEQGDQISRGAEGAESKRRRGKREGRTGDFRETKFTPAGTADSDAVEKESVIQVDELEVYSTQVMRGFESEFQSQIHRFQEPLDDDQSVLEHSHDFNGDISHSRTHARIVVVVVFSPSGSEIMLKCLGFIDEDKQLTTKAKSRQRTKETIPDPPSAITATNNPKQNGATHDSAITTHSLATNYNHDRIKSNNTTKNDEIPTHSTRDNGMDNNNDSDPIYLIATIGATTRDYLRQQFGFEPDICAETPTPEGLGDSIERFLLVRKLV